MRKWITFCILVVPWLVLPMEGIVDQFRAVKEVFFDIMCIGMIVMTLVGGVKYQYKNKYLAILTAWVGWGLVRFWWMPLITSPPAAMMFNVWHIAPFIHFILGVVSIWIAASTLEKEDFEWFGKMICVSASAVSIIGIMQFLHLNPFQGFLAYTADMHVSVFLDNPMLVSNFLGLTIPFFLYYNKPKYYVGLLLVIICLFMCFADMGKICAVVGAVIFLLLKYRSCRLTLWFLLLGTIGICYLSSHPIDIVGKFNNRIAVWQLGYPLFQRSPFFGQGLGVWKTWQVTYRGTWWLEAHSDWIETTIELGILGLGMILALVWNTIRRFWTDQKDNLLACVYMASFISFLILMGAAFPLHISAIGLTGLISFWALERL